MKQAKKTYSTKRGVAVLTALVASLALLAVWASGSELGTAEYWTPRVRQLREATGTILGTVTAGAEDTDLLLGRLEDRSLEMEQVFQDIVQLERQLDEVRVALGGEPRQQEAEQHDSQHDNPQGDEQPQQQQQEEVHEEQQHPEEAHEEQQHSEEEGAQHEGSQGDDHAAAGDAGSGEEGQTAEEGQAAAEGDDGDDDSSENTEK